MKTLQKLTLACCCTLATAMSYAQVSMGPKVGVSSTTFAGTDVSDAEARTGFMAGIYFKAGTESILSIQPEVLYHRKGAIYVNEDLNTRREITLDYLEIPVLIKLGLPVGETIYPHIYAGPYAGVLVGQRATNTQNDFDIFWEEDDFTAATFDAGAVVGAGLDMAVENFFLTFDVRYGIGMLSIDSDDEEESEKEDVKNRTLSFLVGFGIAL